MLISPGRQDMERVVLKEDLIGRWAGYGLYGAGGWPGLREACCDEPNEKFTSFHLNASSCHHY